MRAWLHFACESAGDIARTIVDALHTAGLRTESLDRAHVSLPGIVFFEHCDSALCELLRQLTVEDVRRVLVIALAPSACTSEATWSLVAAGASDVFAWQDGTSARHVAARLARWAEVDAIAGSEIVRSLLVGRSPRWLAVRNQLVEAARFTQAPVLITGESGTGKELAARLVHTLDGRQGKRDLVVLDCSTLVPSLSGSEFFGHERGAFTGAVNARDGAFALAAGGTLFLDEIGELPLDLQTQLLRAVQEHTYKRVGGNVWRRTEFRLVCATNRDLQADVAAGRFRADLYYRIAGVCCHLPPLRERIEDVPVLAEHFLRELSQDGPVRSADGPVLSWLLQREYQNNVRELRLVLARMLLRHAGDGPITVGDIPPDERPALGGRAHDWRTGAFVAGITRALAAGAGLKEIGRAAEDIAEQIAIEQGGSVAAAAARLGVTDRALQLRRALRRERQSRGSSTDPPRAEEFPRAREAASGASGASRP
jgi:transcriptional regulator with GAF, ATPase, and Fis domain